MRRCCGLMRPVRVGFTSSRYDPVASGLLGIPDGPDRGSGDARHTVAALQSRAMDSLRMLGTYRLDSDGTGATHHRSSSGHKVARLLGVCRVCTLPAPFSAVRVATAPPRNPPALPSDSGRIEPRGSDRVRPTWRRWC